MQQTDEPKPSTSRADEEADDVQPSSSKSVQSEDDKSAAEEENTVEENAKEENNFEFLLQEFKWLTNKSGKSYCNFCDKSIAGGRKHLQRHADSEVHQKNTRKLHSAVKIETALENIPSQKLDREIKIAELKLVMFAAEHNLPFFIFEHLPQFLLSLPDREVLKSVKCSGTKATSLVNDKIGPFAQAHLANVLKETVFSVIIDETTDISTCKCLVILVRYYNNLKEKVVDSFFGLIELEQATADAIFKAVLNVFSKFDIPVTNIIGFASDNASVMMGHLNGVKAKFQEIVPNIFVMGCVSHSLYLCASKACASLPNEVENMARNIFNYFAHSAKRQHDLKEFQEFVEIEPHKMLRPSQTRWLSLQAVISRILQQWNALILYFQNESLVEHVYGAQEILNSLHNVEFKLYFHFLQHILNIITKMNLEFQSENPRIHHLLPTIKMYYTMIVKFYIRPEIVNAVSINRINPNNPDYFRKIEDVYFGAGFETTLKEKGHCLTSVQLHGLKINCLSFYKHLCTEIRTRIDFENDVLNDISNVLNIDTIFNDVKPSIISLAAKFPNMLPLDSLENLNLEWRLLCDYKPSKIISNVEELIQFLKKLKNPLGETLFSTLVHFFKALISLPHGSASAERIFSILTMIKNKYRNSLKVSTVESLLFCKELLKNDICYTWEPNENLINFRKSN